MTHQQKQQKMSLLVYCFSVYIFPVTAEQKISIVTLGENVVYKPSSMKIALEIL